jgi:hypothetical protein
MYILGYITRRPHHRPPIARSAGRGARHGWRGGEGGRGHHRGPPCQRALRRRVVGPAGPTHVIVTPPSIPGTCGAQCHTQRGGCQPACDDAHRVITQRKSLGQGLVRGPYGMVWYGHQMR